ncbi:MAG: type I restriction enzyme HsdR N-terminal domain-containing protein [Bacteroidales bacterium]|nr:type I restriction enzyme HsdR N-terminal domain-containing protein [Bacteroidales bacterium]
MWDPLRRKEVADTPEESVRQWFIGVLENSAGVPRHMMMSEVAFKFGDKPFRADILVYDRNLKPLAVVECKRPDVEITGGVAEQAMRYNSVLDVGFIFLTNGDRTLLFRREGGVFVPKAAMPSYEEMLLCRQ